MSTSDPGTTNLAIDGDRLWQSLMEMSAIGATPAGGVCRLALSDEDVTTVRTIRCQHCASLTRGIDDRRGAEVAAGVDELIVASAIFDPAARLRSCELLAGACLRG